MSSIAIEESSTLTSNSVQYRLVHKWTIKDFASTHLVNLTVKSPGKDRYPLLYSTEFCSSQDKKTQFRIMLRRKSDSETNKSCISMYLSVYRYPYCSKAPLFNYKLSLLNDRNEKCHTKEFNSEEVRLVHIDRLPDFLEDTILLDPVNGLLPADQLTILAEVSVYPEPLGQFGNELLLAKYIWEAREVIGDSLCKLLNSGEHSDVVLVLEKRERWEDEEEYEEEDEEVYEEEKSEEGEELYAHKNILSLHSPVFSAMFKSEMVERIRIPDIRDIVAEKMFHFIYTGYVDELDYFAEELYEAADKYGISRLKEMCCQSLCDQVKTYTAANLLAFADRHSVDQLKNTCVNFIRRQWEDIVLTYDWSLVDKLFFEELRLLKHKEKEEEKMEETPEESSSINPPASAKYRLQHKWIITEFASTYLGQSPDKATYPDMYSVWFSSALDKQNQFRLLLKPRSENEKGQNGISLYLEIRQIKDKRSRPVICKTTEVNCKLSLLNSRNEKCHSREFRRELQHSASGRGFANLLTHTRLLDPAKGLLPSDQLTIIAEIDVFPNKPGSELPLGRIELEARENVASSLGTLLDSGDYSDVVLVVKGQELAAHKNILSAHSPVFSAMFKSAMVEREEGRVLIDDMEIEVAQVLLRFIYTGVVEDLEKYVQELLIAADKYSITQLKALCSQYLCGRVDPNNVGAMLTLADRYSVDQLKKVCMEFIRRHIEEVLLTDDWSLVQKLFTEELRLLKLKEKELNTPEESESSN